MNQTKRKYIDAVRAHTIVQSLKTRCCSSCIVRERRGKCKWRHSPFSLESYTELYGEAAVYTNAKFKRPLCTRFRHIDEEIRQLKDKLESLQNV